MTALAATFEWFARATRDVAPAERLELFDHLDAEQQKACWDRLRDKLGCQRLEHVRPTSRRYDRTGGRVVRFPAERTVGVRIRTPEGLDPLKTIEPAVYVEALTGEVVAPDGMAHCPLPGHDDRTPSFRAYPEAERGWYCWGCNRGGTIIDFGGAIYARDPRRDYGEIRQRLAADLLGRAAA